MGKSNLSTLSLFLFLPWETVQGGNDGQEWGGLVRTGPEVLCGPVKGV